VCFHLFSDTRELQLTGRKCCSEQALILKQFGRRKARFQAKRDTSAERVTRKNFPAMQTEFV
jgi:hypothetical protein